MTRFHTLTAALLASTALAGAAHADVTAQQVWDSYRAMLSVDPAATVTIGETVQEGNTLILRDVSLAVDEMTNAYGSTDRSYSSATYPEMRFTENGDGTVTMTMGGESRAMAGFETDGDYGDSFEIAFVTSYDDYSDLVSGTPERMNHDMTFGGSVFEVTSISADGVALDITKPITLRSGPGTGTMVLEQVVDQVLDLDGSFSVTSLDGAGEITGPDGERVSASFTIQSLSMGADITMPMDMDPEMETLPENFDFGFDIETGAASMTLDADTPDGPVSVTAESGGEILRLLLNPQAFAYEQNSKDVQFNLQSVMLPFPVTASAAELGMVATMPLAASDKAQDFRVALFLDTIDVNEEIWAMVDYVNQLPHDPITLRADISGAVKVLMDLTSEEAMMSDMPPFEPVSARIDELTLSAVGVNAEGEGALEFDASDLDSFDGMPAPVGSLRLSVEGLNALLDTLVSMGLIPEDEVTMGRMMMGAFTVPTGDDALSTEVEFREGGQVFANGQRLK